MKLIKDSSERERKSNVYIALKKGNKCKVAGKNFRINLALYNKKYTFSPSNYSLKIFFYKGDVYTFGCGMFGQLGTGSVLKQSLPHIVNIAERIKLIASGHFHVVCFPY